MRSTGLDGTTMYVRIRFVAFTRSVITLKNMDMASVIRKIDRLISRRLTNQIDL